jgi:hypothetical protein
MYSKENFSKSHKKTSLEVEFLKNSNWTMLSPQGESKVNSAYSAN